ncbi:excinuclease ABC subunit C [Bacillus benzoevorans]|uniref:Excinuclease ABC subunit C n=2 Tax=Bacillus benzoevorans TaxID=1456 RepID=A0A7X0HQN9_9BACI|nr:UvrB/UvrC motif-containing protein [Bacillus benzoevorans]MBB6443987.1 excinuclease ABC subunit C [Bacillus benzoevorans]
MKDSTGSIIYVGKAKILKRRVQSYFYHSINHSPKVMKLVQQIKDFDIIQTDTEFEAFMLECQLIKELKPFYNSLMKNPLSYVYISINMNSSLPEIVITNEAIERNGYYYFGPFTNKNTVKRAVEGIKDFYKINCSAPANQGSACLNYSLHLCIGMCRGGSAINLYRRIVEKLMALFAGTDIGILEELQQRMVTASENCHFEEAVKWRDCMNAIQSLLHKEHIIQFTEENNHIIAAELLNPNTIKLFLIYRNQIIFSKKYVLKSMNLEILKEEIKNQIHSHDNHPHRTSKDEIDEAQIIYHYLKHSGSRFFVIPDSWSLHEYERNIEKQLFQLILKE